MINSNRLAISGFALSVVIVAGLFAADQPSHSSSPSQRKADNVGPNQTRNTQRTGLLLQPDRSKNQPSSRKKPPQGGKPKDSTTKGGGSRLGGYTTPPPANQVPAHTFNIIVGRLTDHSATIRVLFHRDAQAHITYGTTSGELEKKTDERHINAGETFDFVINSLDDNRRYFYQLVYREKGRSQETDEFTFHTQRDANSPFIFTVQADSHLDENTSGEVYLRTLANAAIDQPDFHFALGDTFMTGKYVKPELSQPQYLAQRYYLGQLCHSAALYFALGNHDGESGNRGSNLWATNTRKRYLPNPSCSSSKTSMGSSINSFPNPVTGSGGGGGGRGKGRPQGERRGGLSGGNARRLITTTEHFAS